MDYWRLIINILGFLGPGPELSPSCRAVRPYKPLTSWWQKKLTESTNCFATRGIWNMTKCATQLQTKSQKIDKNCRTPWEFHSISHQNSSKVQPTARFPVRFNQTSTKKCTSERLIKRPSVCGQGIHLLALIAFIPQQQGTNHRSFTRQSRFEELFLGPSIRKLWVGSPPLYSEQQTLRWRSYLLWLHQFMKCGIYPNATQLIHVPTPYIGYAKSM